MMEQVFAQPPRKRPFISVVVPTMRVGGLDVLCAGLAGQTFRDFELVLSDNVGPRVGLMDLRAAPGFVHTVPEGNEFPLAQFCRTSNEALVHARGEVVFMMVDYTWLPPNTLAEHAKFHRENPEKTAALMMPHEYRELPQLCLTFEKCEYKSGLETRDADNAEAQRYAEDVANGVHEDNFWSIFEKPMTPGDDPREALAVHPKWGGADPKNKLPAGSIVGNYFHAKNESVKLDVLLDANGWDEDLDGTHCFQDSDLAERLEVRHGVRWTLSHAAQAQIINPRTVFPFAKRERDYMTNEMVWKRKKARGYVDPVNDWSIRDRRAAKRIP